MNKYNMCVFFGGPSVEHQISIRSALHVVSLLHENEWDLSLVYVDRDGSWWWLEDVSAMRSWSFAPDEFDPRQCGVTPLSPALIKSKLDHRYPNSSSPAVMFPLMHGYYGEDGLIQAQFDILQLPYIGSSASVSSLLMHKGRTKDLLKSYDIPCLPHFCFPTGMQQSSELIQRFNQSGFSFPVIIKPASGGSSVGVKIVYSVFELCEAASSLFGYDVELICEPALVGLSELECAVLQQGPFDLLVSQVAEIKVDTGFYDYDAKYVSNDRVLFDLSPSYSFLPAVRSVAKKVFDVCGAFGLARIDFLYHHKSQKFYFNEVNTMPGFTPSSLYHQLIAREGFCVSSALQVLWKQSSQRFIRASSLKRSYTYESERVG